MARLASRPMSTAGLWSAGLVAAGPDRRAGLAVDQDGAMDRARRADPPADQAGATTAFAGSSMPEMSTETSTSAVLPSAW